MRGAGRTILLLAALLEPALAAPATDAGAPVAEVPAGPCWLPLDVALLAAAVQATGLPARLALGELWLVDEQGGRVPHAQVVDALESEPQIISLALEARPSEPGVARGRVVLPSGGLPLAALRIPLGARSERGELVVAELAPSPEGDLRPRVLARTLFRGGSTIRVPIGAPWAAELFVTIHADGATLDATSVDAELELPGPLLVVAPRAGRVTARFGGDGDDDDGDGDTGSPPEATDPTGSMPVGRWLSGMPGPATLPELAPPGRRLDPSSFDQLRPVRERLAAGTSAALKLDVLALGATGGTLASVRLLDDRELQIPYIVEWLEEPAVLELFPVPLKPGEGGRHSRYGIGLPARALPGALLVLETPRSSSFERQVWLEAPREQRHRARDGDEPATIVASALWRDDRPGGPAPAVVLELPPGAGPELVLVVDEAENAQLALAHVRLLVPGVGLRFVHPAGGVRLACGAALEAPRYDVGSRTETLLALPCERALTLSTGSTGRKLRRALPEELFGIVAVAFSILILLLIAWLLRAAPPPPDLDDDAPAAAAAEKFDRT